VYNMTGIDKWHLLFVDDDKAARDLVKEILERQTISGAGLQVETSSNLDDALGKLEKYIFDIIILDVKFEPNGATSDEEVGIKILEAVKKKYFIPIIFYTGLPSLVCDIETPLIKVITKESDPEPLISAVKEIFSTRIPEVNRALMKHLQRVLRDYMWDFVAKNWDKFCKTGDGMDLAYLLSRRLAISLSGPKIKEFCEDLGESADHIIDEDKKIHPMFYYIIPPVIDTPICGDIFQGKIGEEEGFWILITPTCYIMQKKVEKVLVAKCELLKELKEYNEWIKNPSKANKSELLSLLNNNRKLKKEQPDRYHYLPGALSIPDLIVDFLNVKIISLDTINTEALPRLASLDSPFAESVLSRFSSYFGRIGTPDLDYEFQLEKFKPSPS
jgi:CheY-like chemotaxis protein